MALRRHIIAAHDPAIRATIIHVMQKIREPQRGFGYGLIDHLTATGFAETLRDPSQAHSLLTVFVTGHGREKWTLDTAGREESIIPFGVIVMTTDDTVWADLLTRPKLRFVANASNVVELKRWDTFSRLHESGNTRDVNVQGIPRFLDLMASRPFSAAADQDPVSRPYEGLRRP